MAGRALIAGAGVAGLTLALSLARRGEAAHLVERAPVLEETGAGVQLSPNAGRVLDRLGLGPALDEASTRPEGVVIADGLSGRTIKTLPLGASAEKRWGSPYRVLHRADLQSILLAAVRAESAVEISLGSEILQARETASGVALSVAAAAGAAEIEGGWLAGADGLRSSVRRAAKLPTALRGSGLKAWRAVMPASALPTTFDIRRVAVWLAPGAHMVVYPVRGGREANVVLIGDDRIDAASAVVERWAAPARALVDAAVAWTPWPLHDRLPDARLARGRIALLGDAAHAALPSLAQGAGFAIEDAAVLARLVAGGGPDPLGAYQSARLMRVARLQTLSRRQMAIDHMSGFAAKARDVVLAAGPAAAILNGLDWIYGWRDAE